MKWIENLIVREAGKKAETLAAEIADHFKTVGLLPGLVQVKFYLNAALPGDLKIALIWNSNPIPKWGSDAGQLLGNALKAYGLVDHTVWIEQRQTPKKYDSQDIPQQRKRR